MVVQGCASHAPIDARPVVAFETGYTLRLIGHRNLDTTVPFGGTTVGGLSGIDYDVDADLYYLVSDDGSMHGPTRFYTARLTLDADGLHDVSLQTIVPILRPDGHPYGAGEADAEAIRFDPVTRTLWWVSEGGYAVAADDHDGSGRSPRHVDPFVRQTTRGGVARGGMPLDPMFRFGDGAHGPRDNIAFEGLSWSADGQTLWVAMEGPLLQDGPMPSATHGAWARFSSYRRGTDDRFATLAAQYAYPIDAIPATGAWTTWKAQTGVSEVLETGVGHLLVVERALVLGAGWRIRLFDADWRAASDVAAVPSLADGSFSPMTKRLVLDFDTLGTRIDNVEGLCFGPTLANGHRTLVAVSDDNFNPGEVTQFLAFEIIPR